MGRGIVRRLVELVGWASTAGVGLVVLTQAAGWDGFRLVATLQSLTPYGIPLIGLVAALAAVAHRVTLAVVATSVGAGLLVLAAPLVLTPDQPDPPTDASLLRVASVNLLYSNHRVDEIADDLITRDLDVIVFSEYTPEHAAVLGAHPLADLFPDRIGHDSPLAGGMALWSRFPLDVNERNTTIARTIDATVEGPDGAIRVVAVHPPTPIHDFDGWRRNIVRIGDSAENAASLPDPTLVIGDFNASYWHPVFRDLLGRGFVDAHIADGRGWSTSWPMDDIVPPFVRLDHALTGHGLVSTDVDDFSVPGSDHAGFVVTVSPSA